MSASVGSGLVENSALFGKMQRHWSPRVSPYGLHEAGHSVNDPAEEPNSYLVLLRTDREKYAESTCRYSQRTL